MRFVSTALLPTKGAICLLLSAVLLAQSAGAVAAQEPQAPQVTVSKPLQKEITEWDEYTGQFTPVEFVEVRARVSGYLDSIHFDDGQLVKKGDLLFVIDPRPYEIALQSAQAQQTQAQARLELANRQLGRAGQLREKDFVSGSVFDERQQEVRAAAAAVELARSDVDAARLNLEYTRIVSPVTGRIGRHEVSVGNLVSGGNAGATTLLTTIVSLDPVQFLFDMSESDFLAYQRAVKEGRLQSTRDETVPVYVRLADERDWPRKGRLDFVDNQVNRSSGTIRARAVFENADFFVTPGQFGRIRIPGSQPYTAILVPDDAVVTDQSNKLVMTVKEDGIIVPKPVRPGPMIDGLRVIRSGLEPADTIVINGLMRARPGAKVTPQPGNIVAQSDPAG
jgi:RND family efflux transporter MFP subunit